MTGADAFIWKILDHPDADLPRLVFADWLQEQGEEAHAEFIRLQCELATMTEEDEDWLPKKIREGELFWENLRRKWEDRWNELNNGNDLQLSLFSRGFIPKLGAHPRDRAVVHFCQGDGRWPFVLAFANLRAPASPAPAFFASPQMQRVIRLDCSGLNVTDAALTPLATSPYYSRLEALDLSQNPISDSGAIIIADSPQLTALQTLDLRFSFTGITAVGLEALARTPNLLQLQELRIQRSASDSALVSALRELYYRYGDGFDSWTAEDEARFWEALRG